MSHVQERGGKRLDFAEKYPRLVQASLPGEAPDVAFLRAQTELILNAAGEGIYGLDLEGRCTFANPAAARMTGHDVSELLGQSMHDVVHHSRAAGGPYQRAECPIYAAFQDGMIRTVSDEVFWRKDGTAFPVDYTSTPLFNGKELVGAVVVFRDITLRHQTEAKLRSALHEVQTLEADCRKRTRRCARRSRTRAGCRRSWDTVRHSASSHG